MNVPIWIAWAVVLVLTVLSVMWFMGKGSILIAGYNVSNKAEKRRYNEKRLCRVLGGGFSVLTIILGISTFYRFKLPLAIDWIVPWGLLGTIAATAILANTICWRKPTAAEE